AAQLFDGLDERELLAAERLDETAAADLAARFGRAIERQELAPARGERLAREQPARHDAIAAQQGLRHVLERFGVRDGARCRSRRQQRPAPRRVEAAGAAQAATAA